MTKIMFAGFLAVSLFAFSAAAEEMTGIITDAKCKHTDTSPSSVRCAQQCVKAGHPAVFVNTADNNKVYKIANQDKVMDHIGQKVTVTADVKDDTLTIDTIKPAEGGGQGAAHRHGKSS